MNWETFGLIIGTIFLFTIGFFSGQQWEIQSRKLMYTTEESAFLQLERDLAEMQEVLNEQYLIKQSGECAK